MTHFKQPAACLRRGAQGLQQGGKANAQHKEAC